jgi:hypothetical protein
MQREVMELSDVHGDEVQSSEFRNQNGTAKAHPLPWVGANRITSTWHQTHPHHTPPYASSHPSRSAA